MNKQHTPEEFDLYQIIRQAGAVNGLSVDESAEYAQLQEILNDANSLPDNKFPWDRWAELSKRLVSSNLPAERPSRAFFRTIRDKHRELVALQSKSELWPLSAANINAQNALMDDIERRKKWLDSALVILDRVIANENELFGPLKFQNDTAIESAATEIIEPFTLAGICMGDENQRQAKAGLITDVFQAVKRKHTVEKHRAVAVGVYRAAEWIGLTRAVSSSKEWKNAVAKEWNLGPIGTRDKYTILGQRNKLFDSVVIQAHELFGKKDSTIKQLPTNFR